MAAKSTGTVLFLPLFKGTFLEMLPVAKALRDQGRWTPVFCLDAKIRSLLPMLDGIAAVEPDGVPLPTPAAEKVPRNEHTASTASLKQRIDSVLPTSFKALLLMRKACRRARKLLDQHRDTRLIIVASDRNAGIETAVIAEANQHGIPTLIVPFALNYPEAAAEPRLRSGPRGGEWGVQTIMHKALWRLFPSWVWIYKGVPLFFQPPSTMFAAWLLGIMPSNPWIIGGGSATQMAVESDAEREQLLEDGMRAEKMIVTGKPSLDTIARQLASVDRSGVRRKLGIGPEERFLLCSVPQLAEHGLLPPERHREEMIFLFTTLIQSGAHILLNLHPRCRREFYEPLARAAGVRIAEERIYDLLPACDLFTSCYSSIVAQAIALGKPTVVFDFYELGYPPFDHAPGVTVVRERGQFLPALQHLLTDHNHYDTCVEAQTAGGGAWAILDGKNTERVLAVMEELMKKSPLPLERLG